VTLFNFNPPGQADSKETKTDTTSQESVAEKDKSPAPESAPPAAEPQPPPAPEEKIASGSQASSPASASGDDGAMPSPEIPAPAEKHGEPLPASAPPPIQEEPAPRRRPTLAAQRTLREPSDGGRNALLATILAIFLTVLGVGLYVYLGEKPPVAAGEVTHMWVYSVHTTTRPMGGEGAAGQASAFDQVLILAKVKLRNQSDHPIVLWDMFTTVKTDSGDMDATAVGPNDFQRAFVAYPKLNPIKGVSLVRETILEPGQQTEGMILSHFTLTKDEWEKQSALKFTIVFRYQKSLILQPPKDIEVIQ
jgi:hypothetical protein